MTTENYSRLNLDNIIKGDKKPVPKLLRLTDVQMPNRNRKKNKFKFKERTVDTSGRYADDPAYTEDVRHLAFPLRRNSGPDSARRKSCSILQSHFNDINSCCSNSSSGAENQLDNCLPTSNQKITKNKSRKRKNEKKRARSRIELSISNRNSSSSSCETLNKSSDDLQRRGQSLDRNMHKYKKQHQLQQQQQQQSYHLQHQQQQQQRKTLCFQREGKSSSGQRNDNFYHRRDSSVDNLLMDKHRHSMDSQCSSGTRMSIADDLDENQCPPSIPLRNSRSRDRYSTLQYQQSHQQQRQNNEKIPMDDLSKKCVSQPTTLESSNKTKEYSRFQIGKRFLKGEIGIKSFNYYLLKEGLKSSSTKKSSNICNNTLPSTTSSATVTNNDINIEPLDNDTFSNRSQVSAQRKISKSEENIYEEIFFLDNQNNLKKDYSKSMYPNCDMCMQQCTEKNCDICLKSTQNINNKHNNYHNSSNGTTDNNNQNPHRYQMITKTKSEQKMNVDYQQLDEILNNLTNQSKKSNTNSTKINNNNATENKQNSKATEPLVPNILQFQSYDPQNPGVYKIETTPVTFTSDYNPFNQVLITTQSTITHLPPAIIQYQYDHHQEYEQQHQKQQFHHQQSNVLEQQRQRSSSSNDLLQYKYLHQLQQSDCYECPLDCSRAECLKQQIHHQHPQYQQSQQPPQQQQSYYQQQYTQSQYSQQHQPNSNIYKTDSRASILSEISVKSENSNRYYKTPEMSDSSLGANDSVYSQPVNSMAATTVAITPITMNNTNNNNNNNNRKYFGSAESCRFDYECRRCSYDGEKCSFSDNCRYECKNCDCAGSSSYFSSDFDDHQFSRKSSARMSNASHHSTHSSSNYEDCNAIGGGPILNNTGTLIDDNGVDAKTSRYAEDFMKHVVNVKRNSNYSHSSNGSKSINQSVDQSNSVYPKNGSTSKQLHQPHHQQQQFQRQHKHHQPQRQTMEVYEPLNIRQLHNNNKLSITVRNTYYDDINQQQQEQNQQSNELNKSTKYKEKCDDTQNQSQTINNKSTISAKSIGKINNSISSTTSSSSKSSAGPNKSCDKHSKLSMNLPNVKNENVKLNHDLSTTGAVPKQFITTKSPINSKKLNLNYDKKQSLKKPNNIKIDSNATIIKTNIQISNDKLQNPTSTINDGNNIQKCKLDSKIEGNKRGANTLNDGDIDEKNNNNTFGDNDKNNNNGGDDDDEVFIVDDKRDKEKKSNQPQHHQSSINSTVPVSAAEIMTPLTIQISPSTATIPESTPLTQKSTTNNKTRNASNTSHTSVQILSSTAMKTLSNTKILQSSSMANTTPSITTTSTTTTSPSSPIIVGSLKASPINTKITCADEKQSSMLATNTNTTNNNNNNIQMLTIQQQQQHHQQLTQPQNEKTKTQKLSIENSNVPPSSNMDHCLKATKKAYKSPTQSPSQNIRKLSIESQQQQQQQQKYADNSQCNMKITNKNTIQNNSINTMNTNKKSDKMKNIVVESSDDIISIIVIDEQHPSVTYNQQQYTEDNILISTSLSVLPLPSSSQASPSSSSPPNAEKNNTDHKDDDENIIKKIEKIHSNNIIDDERKNLSCRLEFTGDTTISNREIGQPSIETPGNLDTKQDKTNEKPTPLISKSIEKCISSDSLTFNQNNFDILDLPLPDIPTSKTKQPKTDNILEAVTPTVTSKTTTTTTPNNNNNYDNIKLQHNSLPANYRHRKSNSDVNIRNIEVIKKSIIDDTKLDVYKKIAKQNQIMHYHSNNISSHQEKPKYLFGERLPKTLTHASIIHQNTNNNSGDEDEIFLNKSGWVQVNQRSFEKSPIRNNEKLYNNLIASGITPPTRVIKIDSDDNHIPSNQFHYNNYARTKSDLYNRQLNNYKYGNQYNTGGGGGGGIMTGGYGVNHQNHKITSCKLEDLITRNDARYAQKYYHDKLNVSVDPQISMLLNERPGFLPVKRFADNDSPPPMTPIISPPPAFQDSNSTSNIPQTSSQAITKIHLSINNQEKNINSNNKLNSNIINNNNNNFNNNNNNNNNNSNNKGMVFSRSFEYDTRKNREYNEIFSKSFDYDLSTPSAKQLNNSDNKRYHKNTEQMVTFSNLTGVSPNYLTKKEKSLTNSRDTSPVYQSQPQKHAPLPKQQSLPQSQAPIIKSRIRNTLSIQPEKYQSFSNQQSPVQNRSRRSQFSKTPSSGGYRSSIDNTAVTTSAINRRLNSCDSGARSDLSNDEPDDDEPNIIGQRSQQYLLNHNLIQKQRSLTPEKNPDELHTNLIKQRSLTPEKRSLTPEERTKRKSYRTKKDTIHDGSSGSSNTALHQSNSILTKQSSSSRSSTLERQQQQQQKYEEKQAISRSSSSSSYSGGFDHENVNSAAHRKQHYRQLARNVAENRIRRSRSLQLTEKSPQSSHKVIVRIGGNQLPTERGTPTMYHHQSRTQNNTSTNSRTNNIRYKQHGILPQQQQQQQQSQQQLSRSPESLDCFYTNHRDNNNRLNDIDKSRSFESNEYEKYLSIDLDKSRSFDDDYNQRNFNNKNNINNNNINNNNNNNNNNNSNKFKIDTQRSYSNDRVYANKNGSSPSSSNRQHTSPQNYGQRLYDHELMYDIARKVIDRSPIMDFRRGGGGGGGGGGGHQSQQQHQRPIQPQQHQQHPQPQIRSRERSPNNFNTPTELMYRHRSFDQSLNRRDQSPNTSSDQLLVLNNNKSNNTSTLTSPISDYELLHNDFINNRRKLNKDHFEEIEHGYSKKEINNVDIEDEDDRSDDDELNDIDNVENIHQNNIHGDLVINDDDIDDDDNDDDDDDDPEEDDDFRKEAALVTEFLYGNKTKTDGSFNKERRKGVKNMAQLIGTTTATGSYSSGSCNYLPKCDNNNNNNQKQFTGVKHLNNMNNNNLHNHNNKYVLNGDDDSNNIIGVNNNNHNNKDFIDNMNKSNHTLKSKNIIKSETANERKLNRKPPIYEKFKNQFNHTIIVPNLDKREMPITRESSRKASSSTFVCNKNNINNNTNSENSKTGNCGLQNNSVLKRDFTNNINRNNNITNENGNSRRNSSFASRSPILKSKTVQNHLKSNERTFDRYKSVSLPKLYFSNNYSTSTDDSFLSDLFSLNNLSSQMRAVSSPLISAEHLIEISLNQQKIPKYTLQKNVNEQRLLNMDTPDDGHGGGGSSSGGGGGISSTEDQQHSGSVLQKFKKTLSQLKGKPNAPATTTSTNQMNNNNNNNHNNNNNNHNHNNTNNNHNSKLNTNELNMGTSNNQLSSTSGNTLNSDCDSSKYRFGPLVWRTSKERRQTKYHRRDKCNSGDSGIQIELENDDYILNDIGGGSGSGNVVNSGGCGGGVGIRSNETSPSFNVRVRRANSAKAASASSTSAKAKALKKQEGAEKLNSTPLPGRSLSQPTDLDRLLKDPDDSDDSDSDCLNDRLNKVVQQQSVFAEVLYQFKPDGPEELALERGALVEVIRRDPGPWWWGHIKNDAILIDTNTNDVIQEGWFPKDFVRIIPQFSKPNNLPNQGQYQKPQQESQSLPNNNLLLVTEAKNCDNNNLNKSNNSLNNNNNNHNNSNIKSNNKKSPPPPPPPPQPPSSPPTATSHLHQNFNSIRESVTKELLETEINYVKLLSSLCIGYLKGLRKRSDIFPTESLILIFSNIEKILRFQQTFLDALRIGVEKKRIAETFLEFQTAFMVYSTYCNSYPRALMELEMYSGNVEALALLENCRISQNLPDLPLQAHLLAPIQRICRYPLHLGELVKYTATRQNILLKNENDIEFMKNLNNENDMFDCKESFEMALNAMKRVTEMVNEGKRHSEYLSRIQARFDNFQGPAINIHSSRLFLQIDASRMTPNLWNNTYTLFLFDRQLIYCKKDLLKRTHYIYKGRIFLDNCRILNIPDGKMFGSTLKNALRIFCDTRNKWFDFCFRSGSSKLRFLNTLSAERQFCGQNLFVSELAAGTDDDNLSDREYINGGGGGGIIDDNDSNKLLIGTDDIGLSSYNGSNVIIEHKNISIENINATPSLESQLLLSEKYKKCDTLPKKSRKLSKDQLLQSTNGNGTGENVTINTNNNNNEKNNYDYHTHSLGRRKIGNWFRKAKSTNTTPSQSPTHHHSLVTPIATVIPTTTATATTTTSSSVNNSDSSSHSSSPALSGFRSIGGSNNHNNNKPVKVKDSIETS